MHTRPKAPEASSWLPFTPAWDEAPDAFCVSVADTAQDVVEFVAVGHLDVPVYPSEAIEAAVSFNRVDRPLLAALLRPAAARTVSDSTDLETVPQHRFYCTGAFRMPKDGAIALVVTSEPSLARRWTSPRALSAARLAWESYQTELSKLEVEQANWEENNRAIVQSLPTGQRPRFEAAAAYFAPCGPPRPLAQKSGLLNELPVCVLTSSSKDAALRNRYAKSAIAESTLASPRDGAFTGLHLAGGRTGSSLVTWTPYSGPPSYPEVRWAAQTCLPSAFRKPRLTVVSPPTLDFSQPVVESLVGPSVVGISIRSINSLDDQGEITFRPEDLHGAAERSRSALRAQGFEAFAWYSPFHSYTEERWGIYIDAEKLDDFACGLIEDLRDHQVKLNSWAVGIQLALQLLYAHELFHANVEATLTWQEINVLRPRHLRYKANVYREQFGSAQCLEEALANWWAWNRCQTLLKAMRGAGRTEQADAIQRVVESNLDLGPPGYKEWRLGHKRATWRRFVAQMLTAKAAPSNRTRRLPLESCLQGPLPYDLRQDDVPVYLVGSGSIANAILADPASFHTPSRRELERALRHYFKYEVDTSSGKGSHEKWKGVDGRTFSLPVRDPVSRIVFSSFLDHMRIDKKTYVTQVRPNL